MIAALTDSAAVAAKNATATIPIVFAVGIDPLEAGLVTSLARPDGNLTGSSGLLADLMAKRLDLLSELVPQARVIALLVNPNSAVAEQVIGKVQEAARAKDRQLCILKAETESELNAAFAALGEWRASALLVAPDNFFLRDQILALVARRSIPAIYPWRESVAAGGLISYGTNVVAVYRQSGTYVGKILKGAKPADLPVQLPTTFEMAINLKTANALGLTIPPEILARADDVIE